MRSGGFALIVLQKKWKIIIIVLVVVCGLIGGSILILSLKYPDVIPVAQSMLNNHKRAYLSDDDFEKYFDDFQTVADMAIQYHEKNENEKYYLYVDYEYSPGIVYESMNDSPIDISENEKESLLHVNEAFSNQGGEFDRIKVDNNFVTIQIGNHRFAVVYSRDGSKPKTIVGLEDRGYSFYTRKVHDDWYFVTGSR